MAANSTAMPSLSFALLMLFLLLTPTHSFHNDRQSLLTFKRLITSDSNQSMADWNPANPFCNWTGVTCNRRHPNRVASLNLTQLDLSGSISPSLGNLSFLRTLDLSGNKLTGHISPQLGRLFRLRELYLHSNDLEGNIPPQLGRLFRLRELNLHDNDLEGNIPSQLSSCRNLTLLSLSFNHLIGNIPRELSSLPHLQKLYLGKNELTGTIPSSLGNLSSLIELDLGFNSLTGPIPSQLISCRNLTFLELHCNNLTGNIPSVLGSLPHLQRRHNVLIDEDMSGHVTDFGIARLIDESSTESLTSSLALKGSMGYIAPEYGFGEPVSTKGDIYSFGILLLEILTRKRPTNDMFSGDLNLHKWVNLAFPSRVKEVIDHNLLREVDRDEFEENNVFNCIFSLIRVALLCSKDSPNERPTMRDVVLVLERLRNDLGENANASRRLRQSISNLLSNTNATRSNAHASNAHSSSSF